MLCVAHRACHHRIAGLNVRQKSIALAHIEAQIDKGAIVTATATGTLKIAGDRVSAAQCFCRLVFAVHFEGSALQAGDCGRNLIVCGKYKRAYGVGLDS